MGIFRRNRSTAVAIVMPIFVGFLSIIQVSQRPRFQMFHAVDILQLVVAGMCFGAALAVAGSALKRTRE